MPEIETRISDTGGTPEGGSLPLTLPKCECICHENGGEPFSCGGMCWHPLHVVSEYVNALEPRSKGIDE